MIDTFIVRTQIFVSPLVGTLNGFLISVMVKIIKEKIYFNQLS